MFQCAKLCAQLTPPTKPSDEKAISTAVTKTLTSTWYVMCALPQTHACVCVCGVAMRRIMLAHALVVVCGSGLLVSLLLLMPPHRKDGVMIYGTLDSQYSAAAARPAGWPLTLSLSLSVRQKNLLPTAAER